MSRLVLAVLLVGCYSPSYTNCEVLCGVSGTCPSGLECKGGVCVSPGQTCGAAGDDMRFPGDDMELVDAPPDALNLGPWGTPVQVQLQALGGAVDDPTLREDLLELIGNFDNTELIRFTRATKMDSWGSPLAITELDGNESQGSPDLSQDGLQIVFSRSVSGDYQLMIAERNGLGAQFGTAVQLPGQVNLPSAVDSAPALSRDKLALVFNSTRTGNQHDLYMTSRASTAIGTSWVAPTPLSNVNHPQAADESGYLSADQLTLYFASMRTGAGDLYMATRPSLQAAFGTPVPITELNTSARESDPWVAPDGRTIYFARDTSPDQPSIFYATR